MLNIVDYHKSINKEFVLLKNRLTELYHLPIFWG